MGDFGDKLLPAVYLINFIDLLVDIDFTDEWHAFYDDFLIDIFLIFNGWFFWVFLIAWGGVFCIDLLWIKRRDKIKEKIR